MTHTQTHCLGKVVHNRPKWSDLSFAQGSDHYQEHINATTSEIQIKTPDVDKNRVTSLTVVPPFLISIDLKHTMIHEQEDVPLKDSRRKQLLSSPKLLNEAPDVIGHITTVLENGGSLDTAVRSVAKYGPHISRMMFRGIVDDADTRVEPDIRTALSRQISSLPERNSDYGMAIRMAMSAETARDPSERSRILKEASEIALNGLKESGKTFCSSLNTPCMVIFGLGIMVPLILMSVLPMMSLSGLFGSSSMDMKTVGAITLILIPGFVLTIISSSKEKNPLDSKREFDAKSLTLLSAIPSALMLYRMTQDIPFSVCIAAILGCILYLVVSADGISSDGKKRKIESQLKDSVFDLGNRMLAGEPFEIALPNLLDGRDGLRGLSTKMKNEYSVCRGDLEGVLKSVFGKISPAVTGVLINIYRISQKNLTEGGHLALNLGRQIRDQDSVRRNIRNELKSMTDTMFGTAAFFAPLVLGLSISILVPIRAISGISDDTSINIILSIYLIELCALIAILLSFLNAKYTKGDIPRRFASLTPISLGIFLMMVNVTL